VPCLTPMIVRLPDRYHTAIELTLFTVSSKQKPQACGHFTVRDEVGVQRGREYLKRLLVQCCKSRWTCAAGSQTLSALLKCLPPGKHNGPQRWWL
jgi:hypothetical protein